MSEAEELRLPFTPPPPPPPVTVSHGLHTARHEHAYLPVVGACLTAVGWPFSTDAAGPVADSSSRPVPVSVPVPVSGPLPTGGLCVGGCGGGWRLPQIDVRCSCR